MSLNEVRVCKKAFCSLFGVGKFVVERICYNLNNNIPSPTDGRGKHLSRPNRISDPILFQINTHIQSIPKYISHYSRHNNNEKRYLAADLNINKLYHMYLEKYETELYIKLKNGEKIKPIVKYPFFAKHFNENFNLSFGSPKSDTCQTCDKLQNLISSEEDIEIKSTLVSEKEAHLMKAELFYTDLRELSKNARKNTDIEVLSFDFQQNMPLPHIPCGDVFYKRQLWCSNFCVYSAKTRFAHFFMYDESSVKKGQNEVISFLHYYFRNILDKNIKTLYLFADNCSSQNKNNALLQYIYSIVQTNTFGFKTVVQRYPEPGHSFLPCDRCFGLIEQKKRKIERVFIPETYKNMVQETCADKFHVIDVVPDNNMLYNF